MIVLIVFLIIDFSNLEGTNFKIVSFWYPLPTHIPQAWVKSWYLLLQMFSGKHISSISRGWIYEKLKHIWASDWKTLCLYKKIYFIVYQITVNIYNMSTIPWCWIQDNYQHVVVGSWAVCGSGRSADCWHHPHVATHL